MANAVEIRQLMVMRGGLAAVHDVTFDVPAGQITGLLGPSGSGKTTVMRAMVGVQEKVTGTVTVLGQPAGASDLRQSVAYMTQAVSVYTDITVKDNLAYFAAALGLRGSDRQAAIDQALTLTGMSSLHRRLVGTLSGGERSRVSLAATLVGDPQVLILDEPTVGLDPLLRRDLWALFRRLAREGRTLVISSHVMDEASRCDKLILMRQGAVVASMTPAELLTQTGQRDADSAFLAIIEAEGGPTGEGAHVKDGIVDGGH